MPTLRDLITQAYDAKVAETKASRDPRLNRGNLEINPNTNLEKKPYLILTFTLILTLPAKPATSMNVAVSYTHLTLPTIYSV